MYWSPKNSLEKYNEFEINMFLSKNWKSRWILYFWLIEESQRNTGVTETQWRKHHSALSLALLLSFSKRPGFGFRKGLDPGLPGFISLSTKRLGHTVTTDLCCGLFSESLPTGYNSLHHWNDVRNKCLNTEELCRFWIGCPDSSMEVKKFSIGISTSIWKITLTNCLIFSKTYFSRQDLNQNIIRIRVLIRLFLVFLMLNLCSF